MGGVLLTAARRWRAIRNAVAAIALPLALVPGTRPASAASTDFGINAKIIRTPGGYAWSCQATWAHAAYAPYVVFTAAVEKCELDGVNAPTIANFGSVSATGFAGVGALPTTVVCMRGYFEFVRYPSGTLGAYDTGTICQSVIVVG